MAKNPNRGAPPAHIAANGTNSNQDIMWHTIRTLGTFTANALICEINKDYKVSDGTVRGYILRLTKAGILSANKGVGRYAQNTYTLIKDTGIDTPRIRKDGTPSTQGQSNEQMWRTMRILNEFDFYDLSLAASTPDHTVSPDSAISYIKHLYRAGYLVLTRQAQMGGNARINKAARYKLIPSKNTGSRPPMVQRVHCVFDPNLGQQMPIVNQAPQTKRAQRKEAV